MNKFRDWIDQGKINEKIEVSSDSGAVNMLLTETLHFANQIHVWHWLAKSGQKHTALGEFYISLREQIDGIAENLIALSIMPVSNGSKSLDVMYSDEVIIYQTKEYRQYITNLIDVVSAEKSDIASIRDALIDLQETIDKFIYKFDLE